MTLDKFERPELFGGVGGLCGNFNNDHNDDFVNPFGMQVSYEGDFGNSWTNNEMSVSKSQLEFLTRYGNRQRTFLFENEFYLSF